MRARARIPANAGDRYRSITVREGAPVRIGDRIVGTVLAATIVEDGHAIDVEFDIDTPDLLPPGSLTFREDPTQ